MYTAFIIIELSIKHILRAVINLINYKGRYFMFFFMLNYILKLS